MKVEYRLPGDTSKQTRSQSNQKMIILLLSLPNLSNEPVTGLIYLLHCRELFSNKCT